MRELRRTHPHVRLDALGPFHTRADEVTFRATVEEFGMEDSVRWRTGRLPYDELGAFIARHRVGLIPGQVSAPDTFRAHEAVRVSCLQHPRRRQRPAVNRRLSGPGRVGDRRRPGRPRGARSGHRQPAR